MKKEKRIVRLISQSDDPQFYLSEYDLIFKKFKDQGRYPYIVDRYFEQFIEGKVRESLYDRCIALNDIKRGVTLHKFQLGYGEVTGRQKWDAYCSVQALTNTKDYKMSVHNMTSDEVDSYNKLRATTLDNFIKRYGEAQGKEKWSVYCNRQKYAGSSEAYFIEKYGGVDGRLEWSRVNSQKAQTIDNFIKRYGEVDGNIRFNQYCSRLSKCTFVSASSQKLFWKLFDYLTPEERDCCYFNEHGGEFGKMDTLTGSYRFFDFVVTNIKYCIEYNGDCWHANPALYSPEDTPNPFTKETAEEIWSKDLAKNSLMIDSGFIVDVVWESSYNIETITRSIDAARKRC